MKRKSTLVVIGVVLSSFLFLGNDGCDNNPEATRQTRQKIEATESLMKKQPGSQINFSMDRFLLNERIVRFNDPNKMTYLYVVLPDGTWLQTTIIGKLASTSKRLTPPETIQSYSTNYHWGQAPDEMGVWGHSEPAKVGMTTLGSLLEIGGFLAFLYSETPLTFKNLNKPMVELTIVATDAERAEFLKTLEAMKQQRRTQ